MRTRFSQAQNLYLGDPIAVKKDFISISVYNLFLPPGAGVRASLRRAPNAEGEGKYVLAVAWPLQGGRAGKTHKSQHLPKA